MWWLKMVRLAVVVSRWWIQTLSLGLSGQFEQSALESFKTKAYRLSGEGIVTALFLFSNNQTFFFKAAHERAHICRYWYAVFGRVYELAHLPEVQSQLLKVNIGASKFLDIADGEKPLTINFLAAWARCLRFSPILVQILHLFCIKLGYRHIILLINDLGRFQPAAWFAYTFAL